MDYTEQVQQENVLFFACRAGAFCFADGVLFCRRVAVSWIRIRAALGLHPRFNP